MRIMFEIGHPGHVHQFKNMIWELEKKGHKTQICTIDKDVTLDLLEAYGFEYEIMGINRKRGIIGKIPLLIKSEYRMLNVARKFKPDIFVSRGSPISAHVSKILHRPNISFNDTEHSKLVDAFVFPFVDSVLTPSCFKIDLGESHIRYEGYHELAYLHPAYFKPDPGVLNEIGLNEGDTFVIVRFVSWGASHDVGQYGIKNKIRMVEELEKYAHVLITSEDELEEALEKYKVKVSPEKLHDLLHYASLYVGEGGTTAVESAILATPSIYVSSLVGTMGNFIELEEKYELIYNCTDSEQALEKAIYLLENPRIKEEWKKKRDEMLKDKLDVTEFMVRFIEHYPESARLMKKK